MSIEETIGSRFVIVEVISKKEGRATYKALNKKFPDRFVAVKEMKIPGISRSPEKELQFKKFMGALSNIYNPGIPEIYLYFIEDDTACVVSSWVEGNDLEQIFIENDGQIPIFDILSWMTQIAKILTSLHNREPEILHLDIKPRNIKVDFTGSVSLVDFGLPIQCQPEEWKTVDEPGFRPPEQLFGRALPASDIFSLCAVGYFLLSGKLPEDFPPFCFPPIKKFNSNVPDILAAAMLKGLLYDSGFRYSRADELAADLSGCINMVPVRSLFASAQILCPHCRKQLKPDDFICRFCHIDLGIYEGHNNVDNYFKRGMYFFTKGEFARAERYFYQAYRLKKDNAEILTRIALCEEKMAGADRALKMLRNIRAKYPLFPLPAVEIARILFEKKEIENAKKILNEIKQSFPQDVSPYILEATMLMTENNFEAAIDVADRALQIMPENREATMLKLRALSKMEKGGEMAEIISKIERFERNAEMEFMLGLHYQSENEFDRALDAFLRAANKDPENPELMWVIARLYRHFGNTPFALRYYREALRLSNENMGLVWEMVKLMKEKGMEDEARLYEARYNTQKTP